MLLTLLQSPPPSGGSNVLASENFTGTNGAGWGANWSTFGGTTTIQNNAGQYSAGGGGFAGGHTVLSGMTAAGNTDFSGTVVMSAANIEQYVEIQIDASGTDGVGTYYSPQGYILELGYAATAASSTLKLYSATGASATVVATLTRSLVGTTKYGFRIQRIGTTLNGRVWDASGSEPSSWDVTFPLTTAYTGKVALGVVSGASATTSIATFDTLVVTDGTTGGKTLGTTTSNLSVNATLTAGGDPLQQWKTALGNRATALAKWVVLGDSIAEGQGASAITNRWSDLVLNQLRTNNAVTGGYGYRQAANGVYGPDSPWGHWETSHTGTIAYDTNPGQWPDIGTHQVTMSAGASITYSITGTDIDLLYLFGGGGSFTYKVDAASAVTVNPANTGYGTAIVPIATGLSNTAHTVVVTAVSGGLSLSGFTAYNGDRSAGITKYDSGATSATIDKFTAQDPTFTSGLNALAPDLITISMGANDPGTESSSVWGTKLAAWLDDLRTLTKQPSIVFIQTYATTTTTNLEPYANYVAQAQSVCASKNVVFVDLTQSMPTADTSGTGYYTTDWHPNNTGQALYASVVRPILDVAPATSVTTTAASSANAALTTAAQTVSTTTVASSANAALTQTARTVLTSTANTTVDAGLTETFITDEISTASSAVNMGLTAAQATVAHFVSTSTADAGLSAAQATVARSTANPQANAALTSTQFTRATSTIATGANAALTASVNLIVNTTAATTVNTALAQTQATRAVTGTASSANAALAQAARSTVSSGTASSVDANVSQAFRSVVSGTTRRVSTLATEDWNLPDGSAWPSAWNRSGGWDPLYQTTYVAPTVVGGKGRLSTGTGTMWAYSAGVAWNQKELTDFDIQVEATFADDGQPERYIAIMGAIDPVVAAGDYPDNMVRIEGGQLTGPGSEYISIVVRSNASDTYGPAFPLPFPLTSPSVWRLNRVGSLFSAKAWPVGSAEPADWQVQQDVPSARAAGPFALGALAGADDVATAIDFDNLVVTGPVARESFTGTGSAWPSQWTLRSGTAALTGSGTGTLTTPSGSYAASRADLGFVLGDTDITGSVTLTGAGVEQYAVISINSDGGGTSDTPTNGYCLILDPIDSLLTVRISTAGSKADGSIHRTYDPGVAYNYRFQRIGSTLNGRVWTGTEPSTWDITRIIAGTPFVGAADVALCNGNDGVVRTATWGPLVVTVPEVNTFVANAALTAVGTTALGAAVVSSVDAALTATSASSRAVTVGSAANAALTQNVNSVAKQTAASAANAALTGVVTGVTVTLTIASTANAALTATASVIATTTTNTTANGALTSTQTTSRAITTASTADAALTSTQATIRAATVASTADSALTSVESTSRATTVASTLDVALDEAFRSIDTTTSSSAVNVVVTAQQTGVQVSTSFSSSADASLTQSVTTRATTTTASTGDASFTIAARVIATATAHGAVDAALTSAQATSRAITAGSSADAVLSAAQSTSRATTTASVADAAFSQSQTTSRALAVSTAVNAALAATGAVAASGSVFTAVNLGLTHAVKVTVASTAASNADAALTQAHRTVTTTTSASGGNAALTATARVVATSTASTTVNAGSTLTVQTVGSAVAVSSVVDVTSLVAARTLYKISTDIGFGTNLSPSQQRTVASSEAITGLTLLTSAAQATIASATSDLPVGADLTHLQQTTAVSAAGTTVTVSFNLSSQRGGRVRVSLGNGFTTGKPVRVFDGQEWKEHPVKYYTGSEWLLTPN